MKPLDQADPRWLDAGFLAPRLHAALPGCAGSQLAGATLHQSRRRLSRKTEEQGAPFLDLGVALQIVQADGTPDTRWCHLQVCSRGHSAALAREGGGTHLPELDAVLWPMEGDTALDQLPAFLDPAQAHAAVARWCDGPLAAGATPPRVQVVRYEPRTHVVARFELPRLRRPRAVWGKAYAGDTWQAVARRLIVLWPYGQQQDAAFRIARPAGASAALRTVWQDEVLADPLRDSLATPAGPALLAQTAEALGRLQAMPLLSSQLLGPAQLLARATKQARKLAMADASLAAALGTLVQQLAAGLPAPAAPCNVHGDFHVDQLRVIEGRLVLFDLDEFAVGHAAHDIADFASQLLTDDALAPALRTGLASGFVSDAVAASPHRVAADDLDWHLRALLLRKAYSFFVRHRSGWPQRVRHALALAAGGLAALDTTALEHAA